jgi:cation:H+ antiporter
MYQVLRLLAGVALLAIAAQGVVYGATIIAEGMGMSLLLVGMLIIAMGGALPEIYFTVISARRGETGMIIGNLMGSVIIPATFVLGTVAIISPIHNDTLQFSTAARVSLVLVAAFFLVVSQTRSSISRREAIILGVSYVLFILSLFYLS